jgi:hypothetical protein
MKMQQKNEMNKNDDAPSLLEGVSFYTGCLTADPE